jgi:hypothetical protein
LLLQRGGGNRIHLREFFRRGRRSLLRVRRTLARRRIRHRYRHGLQ